MSGNVQIGLDRIEKSFGATRVLDGVSLNVAPGEFVALVGPSGCGKSTLLRIAAGLERPDRGRVMLSGADVTIKRAAERDVAMVFQSYALYPHLTARQNMMLPLVMRRLTKAQRLPFIGRFLPGTRSASVGLNRSVEASAEMLRISLLLDRKPGQMSGGQRQRVALGRALVRRPQAFLMDEPLSNLDASLRVHTRGEIVELNRSSGATTLYVTHDQEEALSMADRVAVMRDGRILQVADPRSIYQDPAHIEVACFIGSPRINLLAARVSGGWAHVGSRRLLAGVDAPEGAAVTLAFRPEAAQFVDATARGALPVTVERTEYHGSEGLAHLRTQETGEVTTLRVEPHVAATLSAGDQRHIAPAHLLAFGEDGLRRAATQIAALESAYG